MKAKEIAELLNGKIVGCQDSQEELTNAFSSDLMSDVLRLGGECSLLITGLCNIQTIRTAEMAMINTIILARGKTADEEMIEHAIDNDITIIETEYSIFKTSGILYTHGIKPMY